MYYDVIIIHPRLGRCTSGFAVGLRLVDQRSLVECFSDVMAHHARYSAQLNDTIFAIPRQCLTNMHGLPALARPAGLPALCMRNIVFVWGRALVIGGVCHRIGAKTPCGFAKSTHPPVAAVAPEAALDDLPLHWTEAVLATVHSEI